MWHSHAMINPIQLSCTLARFILFLCVLLATKSLQAETLRIAVAANFTEVSKELAARFTQLSGHQTRLSYGSSGKLYAQIVHGAPYDVFLAADEMRPLQLVKQGLALETSRFTYARGRLVLWSAQSNLFKDGETMLRGGNFQRLAIANPMTAPYGLAAQQVLQHLGLWQKLAARRVQGDSISQTFQFTATGNAELGLVALSQIRAWPKPGTLWLVPEQYYRPLSQQAVLLKRGENSVAARAFMQFLQSGAVKQLIRAHGYIVE